MKLSSKQNPKIKQAISLTNRRERNREKLFLIEGYRELLRAQAGGVTLQTLFFCPELFLGANENTLITKIASSHAALYEVDPHLFAKLSYRDRPDGLLAIAHQMETTEQTLETVFLRTKNPFFVIAEAIEKPGNLGTILRSSDAAGVDAVIVCDPCTDIYNPNVVRASVGTLFTLPVIQMSSEAALHFLKKHKIALIAATPAADQEFTKANLTGPLAIAVGTEQLGLSDLWMRSANSQVKIPMHGVADSLNVATATTLLLYEVVRQRCL